MKLVLSLPLIVALLGLVVYLLPLPGKAPEVGRLAFFAGLLAFLLAWR